MRAYLAESWPILAALAFLALLTYGAIRPYMKRDAKTSPTKETSDD